jgi:CRISPR-associated protein Csb3
MMSQANITIPVDLTNPGQFFACCGLLELADRLWPGAEGWFEGGSFHITANRCTLTELLRQLSSSAVSNTMSPAQLARLNDLSAMKKKDRTEAIEEEKKSLESLRRELPITLSGKVNFLIDWFCDDLAGGSRFKTWAGQQSVLDIAQAMHSAIASMESESKDDSICSPAREIGLPFNFDSDLGGQGSARDIGFSFDPLAGNEITRIEGTCKPVLEILAFIGLQRFRPREIPGQNRFVYVAWPSPLSSQVAACATSQSLPLDGAQAYAFQLLYRTKYLKSFLPAQPFQGDRNE